ncbi:TIGR04452 family lipoprotein [Leptospira sp. WS92.C1]
MKTLLNRILILLLFSQVYNCVLFDTIGLSPGRIDGAEAATEIRDAAIVADIVNNAISPIASNGFVLSILSDRIAAINLDGYYVKSEVDACVNEIKGTTGYAIGSTLTILLQTQCTLTEDKAILDSPFPEF